MLQACYAPATTPPVGHGSPSVTFEQAAPRTQRQRVAQLAKDRVIGELLGASEKRARDDGDRDLAEIIKRMKINRWNDG